MKCINIICLCFILFYIKSTLFSIDTHDDQNFCEIDDDCPDYPCMITSCESNRCIYEYIPNCCTNDCYDDFHNNCESDNDCPLGEPCTKVRCEYNHCHYGHIPNCCTHDNDCRPYIVGELTQWFCDYTQSEIPNEGKCVVKLLECIGPSPFQCNDKLCHTKSCKNNECVYDTIISCCTEDDQCDMNEYCDYTKRQKEGEGICKQQYIITRIINYIKPLHNNDAYLDERIRDYIIENNYQDYVINTVGSIAFFVTTFISYKLITDEEARATLTRNTIKRFYNTG